MSRIKKFNCVKSKIIEFFHCTLLKCLLHIFFIINYIFLLNRHNSKIHFMLLPINYYFTYIIKYLFFSTNTLIFITIYYSYLKFYYFFILLIPTLTVYFVSCETNLKYNFTPVNNYIQFYLYHSLSLFIHYFH